VPQVKILCPSENPPRISPGGPIYATQRFCPRAIATTGTSAVVGADASTYPCRPYPHSRRS
jgi:hypothetical protein